jgi:2-amino-4-hydroxy-6-hydroxymethyldihydropteridine diphosphokinase
MSETALIALGSNLGDRRTHLDAAVSAIGELPGVALEAVSAYHEAKAVGGPEGQAAFLNAAARVRVERKPEELLWGLQAIERRAGRVREARWGARTLDLDLLLYGNLVCETATLTIPHPWMGVRRFVLEPLSEVAAEVVDPTTGRTVADLRMNLERRPGRVWVMGGERGFREEVVKGAQSVLDSGWEFEPVAIGEGPTRWKVEQSGTFAVVLPGGGVIARRAGVAPLPVLWCGTAEVAEAIKLIELACEAAGG